MKVDPRTKKSEAAWIESWDRFFLAATPKIFQWLGWCVLLGAVELVREASGSVALAAIQGTCIAALWFYFVAYFNRIEVVGVLGNRPWAARFVATVISSAMAGLAYWVSQIAVAALGSHVSA
jgi:hypothetical protein